MVVRRIGLKPALDVWMRCSARCEICLVIWLSRKDIETMLGSTQGAQSQREYLVQILLAAMTPEAVARKVA